MRLLLVEDDPILGEGLCTALSGEGYTVDWLKNGLHARSALQTEEFALLILDLGLPGMDGLEVLKGLRADNGTIPVLILTARDSINDKVAGLDLGADDYLPKPFDIKELAARVRSLLRRGHNRTQPEIKVGELSIDPASMTTRYKDKEVRLPSREFSVLRYLMENAGRIISRSQLEDQLYGWNREVESNAVEVYIHNLRKKIDGKIIRTIRGMGYMMDKN